MLPAGSGNHCSAMLVVLGLAYLLLVRSMRHQRASSIGAAFAHGKRPLSSMTTDEAYDIMAQLQELEFPYAMNKARRIALLKAGAIPTMSRLFAATGQNTRRNAGRRSVDTEILLREVQSKPRSSERYMQAVARMNFLHARYRKAGKILDADLLHTLGSNVVEMFRIVDGGEWRSLTDVERCAIGIFHRHLGEDMGIPLDALPSGAGGGWRDGAHFAAELRDWTVAYEEAVARPVPTGNQYVRVYVDSATSAMPRAVTTLVRKILGSNLDTTMRTSLNLEPPGPVLVLYLETLGLVRKLVLRHLCLPRPSSWAVKAVDEQPNPATGLYNFEHAGFQPWYVKPTFGARWRPSALLVRALGGRAPGTHGERFHPQGYSLETIGPAPQEGKGLEEMSATVEFMKGRGSAKCPFAQK
ncbi:hypothetical protein B0T26DRAFT_656598 [Lasiosphaeria miniovina]|uniref:Mycophenolic acid synthesis protein B n=1 Tax=Lasiosphaeria miniovina TaxID=1954250 RepID=A0AA40DL00_9PEZI|nr:uncharacterized protein B0T26DRAFT_656598 [Lasiosphaeria miniovina]KAK0707075.1 hypothetical protein B0T26DRAFT_656598 [Lasiosphaeria miniovina]